MKSYSILVRFEVQVDDSQEINDDAFIFLDLQSVQLHSFHTALTTLGT